MYEEDKTHQILMGLNDDAFAQIWSQILAQEPLPARQDFQHGHARREP